jgi:hypothetical protein
MVVEACATLAGLVFVLIGLLLQLLMKEVRGEREGGAASCRGSIAEQMGSRSGEVAAMLLALHV